MSQPVAHMASSSGHNWKIYLFPSKVRLVSSWGGGGGGGGGGILKGTSLLKFCKKKGLVRFVNILVMIWLLHYCFHLLANFTNKLPISMSQQI